MTIINKVVFVKQIIEILRNNLSCDFGDYSDRRVSNIEEIYDLDMFSALEPLKEFKLVKFFIFSLQERPRSRKLFTVHLIYPANFAQSKPSQVELHCHGLDLEEKSKIIDQLLTEAGFHVVTYLQSTEELV